MFESRIFLIVSALLTVSFIALVIYGSVCAVPAPATGQGDREALHGVIDGLARETLNFD